ncbi:FtsH protease activity modulator HflK [Rickettsiales endosymbiont of Stachyamoeba lipophora]|uniref:FtsH protease activity modulator HflK n=1 Tax=Rickettsiales endosymbiont of Stachyamoeba lipophora TaxID=2486578 RepID=UPI000F6455B9|nr:FtsH protease activity modulator HflK [Rickettsiales endosymbiont of Stachyamoeba lipophora]AZL15648.1 FtsH protease activity modulator HflK [Rickettsiales endosymbiont of Stachyamoeba lipophora]
MTWGENPEDGNKKPWGSQKNNPDLDELFKQTQQKFKKVFGGNNGPETPGPFGFGSSVLLSLIIIITIVWAATGFYIVEEEEQAVVLRFGKFARLANPGPNYHIPFPIEKAIKHKVTNHQIEEFGYRSSDNSTKDIFSGRKLDARNIIEESLMLTGDENIVDINFLVRWKIDNIKNYTFNVKDPRLTVKMAAESAVREVIGYTKFAEAQTEGRARIEQKSMKLLQDILDSYNSGIIILGLQMLKVDPPQQVIDAFRDVQTARADKERIINESYSFKNDLLPKTRGQADKIVKESEAYQYEVIARAEGEMSRYKSIYEQYKVDKKVTKTKLYLETLEQVLGDVNKVIIDDNIKSLAPFLPLSDLNQLKK